ncbi:MAG: helicase-related protein, partial [Thermaerobacter sp.]|nr:helicase-related protein [Thermaerobacter sp.]
PLSRLERDLYDRTTAYIRETYNRAAGLNRSAVRLAMSVFQRRLASSAYALAESLRRRLDKLDQYIARAEAHQLNIAAEQAQQRDWDEDPLETMTGDEESSDMGREEHELAEDRGTSALLASSLDELRSERAEVGSLVGLAHAVLAAGDEAKFQRLRELLRDPRFVGEKLLIFTEHRDTLTYLNDRLEALGFAGRIAHIHGGMPYQEREAQVRRFRLPGSDGGADICLATDAAGEGINLQFCWVMINYDIPWNPARLEQRMGRIHRYKQAHDPVLIFNLVADNTREGRVLKTLLDKLERIRQELRSDKVFDVIGRQLVGWSLRDLLLESLDDDALVRAVDERVTLTGIKDAIHGSDALLPPTGDVMDQLPVARAQLHREAYHRLLPGYVRHFVTHAAPLLGIGWDGELDTVFSLKALSPGALDPLLPDMERYPVGLRNRWILTKRLDEEAVYFHPGEPVFETLRAWIAGRYAEDAARGAVFVDPEAEKAYVCHWILAQVVEEDERASTVSRVVETRLVAVREWADGRLEEMPVEQLFLLQPGTGIPSQWLTLASRAESQLDRVRQSLTESLNARWVEPLRTQMRQQAQEDGQWVEDGYRALEADLAIQRSAVTQRIRAGESSLQGRLTVIRRRQATLDNEKAQAQSRILGAPDNVRLEPLTFLAHALVVPASDPAMHAEFTQEVEAVAVAVAQAQLEQEGFVVWDVSTPAKAQAAGLNTWPGFDLWARHPDGEDRAVEVKGRATRGTILVSDNEWAKACTLRDGYWLYVVWDCGSSHPYCLSVRDPFARLLATAQGGVAIDPDTIVRAVEEQQEGKESRHG